MKVSTEGSSVGTTHRDRSCQKFLLKLKYFQDAFPFVCLLSNNISQINGPNWMKLYKVDLNTECGWLILIYGTDCFLSKGRTDGQTDAWSLLAGFQSKITTLFLGDCERTVSLLCDDTNHHIKDWLSICPNVIWKQTDEWKGILKVLITHSRQFRFAFCRNANKIASISYFMFCGEGPHNRCYGRTAALRLFVQPCDEHERRLTVWAMARSIIYLLLNMEVKVKVYP